MAMEVERRDVLIAHLQAKLRALELNILSSSKRHLKREVTSDQGAIERTSVDSIAKDNSSSDSSAELLFMVSKVLF